MTAQRHWSAAILDLLDDKPEVTGDKVSALPPDDAKHLKPTPSGKPLPIEPQARTSPHNATIQEWRTAITDLPAANSREADKLVGKALAFLDGEAIDAALDADWDAVSLFGVDAGPDWAGHGAAWGLIPWLSLANFWHGAISFSGDTATVETSGACVLTHKRFQPARDCATPFWLHDLEA
jgi:hypothetical protein